MEQAGETVSGPDLNEFGSAQVGISCRPRSYGGFDQMPITALYAALLTPLFVFLSGRVIASRRGVAAALGDGGNPELLRRIRVQGNFAEYVPLGLILLALAESLRTPFWLLHVLGLTLFIGRHVHAYGVSRQPERFELRVSGMVLTLTMLLCAALTCFIGVALRNI